MRSRCEVRFTFTRFFFDPPWCTFRFLFFNLSTGSILGGTQDTLQLLSEAGDADLVTNPKSLHDVVDDATLGTLMAAAELAFNKGTGQIMRFMQVGAWGF